MNDNWSAYVKLALTPKRDTQEIYIAETEKRKDAPKPSDLEQDLEAVNCQNIGGVTHTVDGAAYCLKPHCNCYYNKTKDERGKLCSFKGKR